MLTSSSPHNHTDLHRRSSRLQQPKAQPFTSTPGSFICKPGIFQPPEPICPARPITLIPQPLPGAIEIWKPASHLVSPPTTLPFTRPLGSHLAAKWACSSISASKLTGRLSPLLSATSRRHTAHDLASPSVLQPPPRPADRHRFDFSPVSPPTTLPFTCPLGSHLAAKWACSSISASKLTGRLSPLLSATSRRHTAHDLASPSVLQPPPRPADRHRFDFSPVSPPTTLPFTCPLGSHLAAKWACSSISASKLTGRPSPLLSATSRRHTAHDLASPSVLQPPPRPADRHRFDFSPVSPPTTLPFTRPLGSHLAAKWACSSISASKLTGRLSPLLSATSRRHTAHDLASPSVLQPPPRPADRHRFDFSPVSPPTTLPFTCPLGSHLAAKWACSSISASKLTGRPSPLLSATSRRHTAHDLASPSVLQPPPRPADRHRFDFSPVSPPTTLPFTCPLGSHLAAKWACSSISASKLTGRPSPLLSATSRRHTAHDLASPSVLQPPPRPADRHRFDQSYPASPRFLPPPPRPSDRIGSSSLPLAR
ncbi:hypothetical protein PGT21_032491 [Puccinia graminis f. sp. tritici]|uniref:Uncharacterized protein n=1 Tax=Puccinia graminis f. sp. tritici TaxID=56615 RepID=A0A5B0LRN5_PUCGR|nr:hypothetical protein PGT21_032491 [Puccinia graminis f. sp. tritici]